MVETPILFETFARPQYARVVFDAIKKAQPRKLYFYSNKARIEKPDELKNNDEIRSWINEVDWDCELHTFFRKEYVDVYTSLKGAIDWVFSMEPEAIILEDDCVPTQAFFSFCDQMIARYRNDERVWCISGDNYTDFSPEDSDYYFSHYHFMYGWASWRDKWSKIQWENLPIQSLIDTDKLTAIYKTRGQVRYRKNELRRIKDFVNTTHCWDYALGIEMDYHQAVTAHPKEHLVTCIGLFGENSKLSQETMFHKHSKSIEPYYKIERHPDVVSADLQNDYVLYLELKSYMKIYRRVWRRLVAYIHRHLGPIWN